MASAVVVLVVTGVLKSRSKRKQGSPDVITRELIDADSMEMWSNVVDDDATSDDAPTPVNVDVDDATSDDASHEPRR